MKTKGDYIMPKTGTNTGDLRLHLENIESVADTFANICEAYSLPVYVQSQNHGLSAAIIALAKEANQCVTQIEGEKQ